MTPDLLFSIANNLAIATWVLLAALSRRRWVTDVVSGRAVPLIFGVAYLAIVTTTFAGAEGSFSSLRGVMTLFTNPWMLLAGWLHYLAFDLLIGSWEVRDARTRGIPHWMVIPCLFLTLMFGPVGWLAYRALRLARATPA